MTAGTVRRVVDRPAQVKRLRASLGLSQDAFASLIGCTFVSVNRWENGHAVPSAIWCALLDLLDRAIRVVGAGLVSTELREAGGDLSALLLTLARLAT